MCQYCGSKKELTFDHLLPRSKGGKTNWDNVVTACSSCNVKKGGRLLSKSGMTLNKMPYQPSTEDLHRNGKGMYYHHIVFQYIFFKFMHKVLQSEKKQERESGGRKKV